MTGSVGHNLYLLYITGSCVCVQWRYVVTLMAILALACNMILRVVPSVAIISMVNHSHISQYSVQTNISADTRSCDGQAGNGTPYVRKTAVGGHIRHQTE